MKKSKIFYLLSFLIPITIFFILAFFNDFIPFGNQSYNIFDSNLQYPGFFVQLKSFSAFNFTGGLGFNFIGMATYYLMSPLNLLFLLFKNVNYHMFLALLIYIKIGLSGLTMFIFLNSKKSSKPLWNLLFSISYALCGYMSCYYYNTMWMDSIYMLPLVLLGITKLVDENKKSLYLITLALTIILSYYIGYMVCIFSVIYFIYKLSKLVKNEYKTHIKNFVISSLLAALIACIVIIPAYFALKQGKSVGFGTDFNGMFKFIDNIKYFFFNLTPASFQLNDQSYGPAQIYTSLLVVVLVVMFFFNKKITKKQKIIAFLILLFYIISFSFSLFDNAWQFFQKPVWWQHRYSFTFSAFLIILASDSINNIDNLKMSMKQKIIAMVSLVLLMILSFVLSYTKGMFYETLAIIFIAFSCFAVIDYFLILNTKSMTWFIVLLLILEVSLNSFMNLKNNNKASTVDFETGLINYRQEVVDKIKEYDNSFYRMEFVYNHTSNDGMVYGYNGINYFNSVRNQRYTSFANRINFDVLSDCGVTMNYFNPYILSLLNVKYLVDYQLPYYEKIIDNHTYSAYENPYALSVGFMVNSKILDAELFEDTNNVDTIFSSMIDSEIDSQKIINGYFKADKDYFVIKDDTNIGGYERNDENEFINYTFSLINKGDVIDTNGYDVSLIAVDQYENVMNELTNNLLELKHDTRHILEGSVVSTENKNMLFISIPYDEGLSVFVDGKEAALEVIFDTFIGVELSEGEHEIVIDYVTPGLNYGIVISTIGIGLSILYLIPKHKKRNK